LRGLLGRKGHRRALAAGPGGGGRGRCQCRRCTGGGGWLGDRRGSRDTREGVEVVGRRWSQAEGGAPRAPNNGGAAAFWAPVNSNLRC
jgi:hypothetical protein